MRKADSSTSLGKQKGTIDLKLTKKARRSSVLDNKTSNNLRRSSIAKRLKRVQTNADISMQPKLNLENSLDDEEDRPVPDFDPKMNTMKKKFEQAMKKKMEKSQSTN